MKILIGVSLSKKNLKFLNIFMESLSSMEIPNNYLLKYIFILEEKNSHFLNIIKKILVNKKFEVIFLNKKGIPQSRNEFLKYLRKNKSIYCGFLDDDCIVNKRWLINMVKFIKSEKCDIVGGPQLHKTKKILYKNLFQILEPNWKHNQKINWIATNNAFLKSQIITNSKIIFDHNLKDIGGSDQLFFKKLTTNYGYDCRWNTQSFVVECIQNERESLLWFLKRNMRYGYSGFYIDIKTYGKIKGGVINLLKLFYMLSKGLINIFLILKKNNIYIAIFFLFRCLGRILGLMNYNPKKYT